tara:strand:- start:6415 stop:6687 length:273 start_codon:yes stop_codon:yes gene_type:complete
MKIDLGIRGSIDAINHILIKVNDDFILQTKDNLFFAGEEGRNKTGKNLVELLNTLAKDHEISVGKNVAEEIERELNLENQELQKFIVDKV